MRSILTWGVLAAGGLSGVTICGVTAAAATSAVDAAQPAQVVIKGFMFDPKTLTARVGETITWINQDEEPHTVRSDAGLFASAALDTGESFRFRFDKPGTYHFVCSIHPRMTGTIVIISK